MSEIIKEIDDQRGAYDLCGFKDTATDKLLEKCKTEILFLRQVNESLRNQNTALDEKLAEIEAAGEPVVWWVTTKHGDGFSYSPKFVEFHPHFNLPVAPSKPVS